MMELSLLQIIILSIIQAITEFLPISSSAHLLLPSKVLGWPDQGIIFDITVHFATLMAVLIYFRAEFLRFSSVFDTNTTRETIHNAVVEVTKPLLEAWINRHMADIAKSVIKEAIGKIADVRKPL